MFSVVSVCLSVCPQGRGLCTSPWPQPQTGNVFSCVYLSTKEEGGPCTGPRSPYIFKLNLLGPHCTGPPSPGMLKFVDYVACTVSKPAVGIRLKCRLVYRWKCQTQEENIEGSFYREEKYPNWLKGARDFKNNSKGVSTLENYSRK